MPLVSRCWETPRLPSSLDLPSGSKIENSNILMVQQDSLWAVREHAVAEQ